LNKGTAVLHQSMKSRRDYVGACRFFNNPNVTYEEIIQPVIEQTSASVSGRCLIVGQDTSEINYEDHINYLDKEDKELGPVGNNEDIGFFLHPSIVIDEESEILAGISDMHIWNRRFDKGDKFKRQYARQPIAEKESNRWIAAGQRSKVVLKNARSILFVADREADIYDAFFILPDAKCDVLIRSRVDRQLYTGNTTLSGKLASMASCGNVSLTIRESAKRSQREATLDIKYCAVSILKPKSIFNGDSLPDHIDSPCYRGQRKSGYCS
jgi:hypothetical protein